jgi:hypothetical protein
MTAWQTSSIFNGRRTAQKELKALLPFISHTEKVREEGNPID